MARNKIGAQVTLHKIDGFDYEVSEYGEVRSLSRIVVRANGRTHTVAGKVLKPRWNGGHWQVVLYQLSDRNYQEIMQAKT